MDDAAQSRLLKLKSECGCKAGSAALLVSIGAYVTYAAWVDPIARGPRERVLTAAGVGLAAAVVGKILGVLWARYQYRQLLGIQIRAAALRSGTASFANHR